jgi:flagellar biosynthesis protein FlhF
VPIKTFVGPTVSALFHQAQSTLGLDAVILHVRRLRGPDGTRFEVTAADPDTAARGAPGHRAAATPALELLVPAQPVTGPLVIALVGPTGSGKTTTLAKLAMHPRIFGSRRVGLIGLDTFRIGAVEQLRTYARIAQLPCHIGYLEEDMVQARSVLADCDVWLVDTPGRSPRHRFDRDQADRLLEAIGPHEVHLVLPAVTPEHVACAALAEPRPVAITHLAITKVDEAPDEAALFELAVDRELPIRWITDGQEVPFDLSGADESLAAARLARDHHWPAARRLEVVT